MQNKNEKIVYQGRIVELVQYPVIIDGKEKIFELARRAPGVGVLIKTPEGKFLLNKEKRHELGLAEDLRLPGGKVFDLLSEYNDFLSNQKDESEIIEKARETAIKEAIEEVGINPTQIDFLSISKCGATMEWDLYYFLVTKYEEVGKNLKDTESAEIMGTVLLSAEELKEKALSGVISEDRSVAVILRYLYSKNVVYHSNVR